MNNKFINNGVNLLHTKNKKTKVESQIEVLKLQEQAIITELERWEIKSKKVDKLLVYLAEVNKFSTSFLAEMVKTEKDKENPDDYWVEQLIKNKVEFALKFEPTSDAFYQLVWQKIEFKVFQLKAERNAIQDQLLYQERIFARIEIRRQGRTLLNCEYKNRLGCLGVYRCNNCQTNYSVNSQFQEVTT